MKRYIKRNSLLALALLLSGGSFAQGDFGDPTDTNPTDAPIGDYIWIIALVGVMYVFYNLKNRKKVA